MKRNLLQGIILISAVALSSCSVNNKLAGATTGDDVYYTKAKAGDALDYTNNYSAQQNNYTADDDYYYYGDYASRINRFNYYTPFDYDDDFYYSYSGYDAPTAPDVDYNLSYDNSYTPDYNFADVYSPYDYGYYDFGGYDDFGYGTMYITNLFGGGGSGRRYHGKQYSHPTNNGSRGGLTLARANGRTGHTGGIRYTGITRGGAGNAIYSGRQNNSVIYPGRSNNNNNIGSRNPAVNNARAVRPDNTRPITQQVERTFTPQSPSPSYSGGGNSGGGASSSGGGGRPVRP